MPEATLPANADITALRFVAGSSSYARGVNYASNRRVMRTAWDADALELTGLVRGSGRVYQTKAAFKLTKHGLSFVAGECSCPMEFDCKHVVALVLTASAAAPPTPSVTKTPAWEQSLQRVLDAPAFGSAGETPLGLQLSLHADGEHTAKLMAKIVKPGKTGWVNGNLSWSGLSTNYYGHEYRQTHIRLLQELYAIFESRTAYPSYFYSSQRTFDLSSFESPNLWPLLDEARRLGLRVVHAGKKLGDIGPYGEAELALDVAQDTRGALTVHPVLRVDGIDERVAPITFIGTEAHGVVWAPVDDGNAAPGAGPIRLARLKRPVPQQLQDLARYGGQLDIPADHSDKFVEQYYLRLRKAAAVTSTDKSFAAPEVSGPGLLLSVSYGDNHSVELDLEWQYQIGDHTVRTELHDRSDAPYRDIDRERDVLFNLSEPLGQLGFTDDDHPALDDMPAHAHYSGIDTVRFTTEVLPLLDDHPDLGIDVRGERPDYREATDSVVIGLSADESDDRDWFDLGVSISIDDREVPLTDVITALTRDEPYLLLGDGTYFSLDKPELQSLRRLLDEAQALQDAPPGELRISRYQADLWSELSELGVVRRQADAWARQVDGLLAAGSTEPAELPSTMNAELRPYQRDGYEWLAFLWQHRLGGILADDMGLGKTLQTLALVCHAKESTPDMAPVLIVAPTSVVPGWASEAARFAPSLRVTTVAETRKRRGTPLAEHMSGADVVVTSYTLFRLEYDDYADIVWSGLVLDEAQNVKNHQAKAHQAVRKLTAPFKLAITGTPMENNLMELWSLLSIAAPGLFPSPSKFKEYYGKPIEKGQNSQLLGQLRRRIKPLVKRRTKEQVAADLPAKQEQVLEVDLHPKHRATYDRHLQRERQKVLGLVDDLDKNRFTILRSLTLLRQLSLHAGLVDDDREQTPSAKIAALLDHLQDVVGSGHRALIFSQFTGFLGMVRTALVAAGIDHQYLDGTTRNRGKVLDDFKNGDAPVFLISLKAGGFGLNLTEADYCFLLDPWWNPATEAQAVDRTHRIGQTRNVMVYRLIAKDTIEEKVMALKERKTKLVASVMDDGNAFGSSLSADDIRGLFD